MRCEDFKRDVWDLLDGEPGGRAALAREHAEVCPGCAELADSERRADLAIRGFTPVFPAPDGLWERVRAGVDAGGAGRDRAAASPVAPHLFRAWLSDHRAAAWAFCSLVALVSALALLPWERASTREAFNDELLAYSAQRESVLRLGNPFVDGGGAPGTIDLEENPFSRYLRAGETNPFKEMR